MSSVVFDITKQSLGQIAESIQLNYEDSMLVLAPLAGNISVYAPATKGKYKGYHRFKFEVWIPEDAIEGNSALGDFGAMVLMRLPKNRVKEHLKRDENE
jgi:hypothetical protein